MSAVVTPTAMPAISPVLSREPFDTCADAVCVAAELDDEVEEAAAVIVLTCVIIDLLQSVIVANDESAALDARWGSSCYDSCYCRGRRCVRASSISRALPGWRQPQN